MQKRLLKIFHILLESFGQRNWWPGETDIEVIIGAVLTQNTSWKNVEKAITNLRINNALGIPVLYEMDRERLAQLIRPSGCYNIKSRRLKNIIKVIYEELNGNICNYKEINVWKIRERLLKINGIGRETADSIILYALNKPIFVIDTYTKRFLSNHGIYHGDKSYDKVQHFFMKNLPHDTYLFNEFHALIVCLCQRFCKKTPLCRECPLEEDFMV